VKIHKTQYTYILVQCAIYSNACQNITYTSQNISVTQKIALYSTTVISVNIHQ